MKRIVSTRVLAALLVLPTAATLAACSSAHGKGGGSTSAGSTAPSAAGTGTATAADVKVSGAFGTAPTLTIPKSAAPAQLTQQVLSEGSGATLRKGDLLIANYVGQTWAPKDGKANVFDSSFSRGQPAAFVIGTGRVISGWDKTLVGKKLGSRVLLTIPPADGYGSGGQPSANISGTDTLVFVVDLIAAYHPGASAPGTAITPIPAGLPKLTNVPAKEPKVLSTAGLKAPSKPVSTLIVKGTGAKIDSSKNLVMEFVQADLATGKDSASTWQDAPQAASAQQVLSIADALKDQNIGARAVVLLPATAAVPGSATQESQAAEPATVLVIDVVGQF